VSQVNLSQQLLITRNKDPKLKYIDSSGNRYARGKYADMPMTVDFYFVEFNRTNKTVTVRGIATVLKDKNDTIGLCCVNYFIAKPIRGYLTSIRKLGQTNSQDVNDKTKRDGYFSFKISIDKEDHLYFISGEGKGLEEYDIGKTCFDSQTGLVKK